MISKELQKNQFGLKRFSGVDHKGNNIGYQCKGLGLNINNEIFNILIDIGAGFDHELAQGINKNSIGNFDMIVLTHNHYDHVAGLPIVVKSFVDSGQGKHKPIFMSNVTAETIRPILDDMTKEMKIKTTKYNKKIKAQGNNEFISNLYKKEVIDLIMRHRVLINPRGYETSSYRLFNNKMNIRALYAGHIFGANQYLFKITGNGKQKNTNILFSGDLGRIHQPIHFDPPEIVTTEKIDYMIIEGTYANKEHNSREEEKKKLIETIKNRKGKILMPTFSNTRLIQIILILREHRNIYHKNNHDDKYNLGSGAKVFIDSKLGMELLKLIVNYNGEIPGFSQEQVHTLRIILESISKETDFGPFRIASKKTILDRSQKDIIVAGGGMGQIGPSVGYISRFLDNCDKNEIIFTGYQAKNTNGCKIQERGILHIGNRFFDLSSHKYEGKKISSSISMSAHADQNDLLTYINQTNKRSDCKIFIDHTGVHGYVLKDKIISELGLKPEQIIIPEIGRTYNYPI